MVGRRMVLCNLVLVLSAWACKGNSEREGMLAAQREAEAELQRERVNHQVATKMRAPVQGARKIECTQLIDMPSFREVLEEKEPLSMRDVSKSNADANVSCSLIRGGRMLSIKEQQALIKRSGKLGVLPGDELCNITAYCGGIEEDGAFKKRCAELKRKDDDSMGSYACVQIVPHGAVDVMSFRFLDPETKCVIEVRGGPSMTDNAFIASCAKAARDLIGPAQIADPGAAPAAAPAADPAP
jgi:hypothetical protein